jgi:pimeloyl-ACP methyl ester carboxylesterase
MGTNLAPSAGDLGGRVARRRMELGLTRGQLAARAGIPAGYLTYLETHVAHVGSLGLARLADALEMSVDELLGGPPSRARRGPDSAGTGAMAAGRPQRRPTVLFIHDAWLRPSSWENFVGYFSSRGYESLSLEWPASATATSPAGNGHRHRRTSQITGIVDGYDEMIREMSNPPVIIGHGFGGLFTQLLLNRGAGAAGVVISPVPPSGTREAGLVSLRWGARALASSLYRRNATSLTFQQFKGAFANTWPAEAARAAYERYSVPVAGQLIIDRLLAWRWHPSRLVNYYYDERAPLLMIAAKKDNMVPPSAVAENCRRYSSLAETDFAQFPGRSHLVMLERGWEEVADYIDGWLMRHLTRPLAT